MTGLEAAIGYEFADRSLLELALTHRSVSADDPSIPDNERLEFLGDAVLQLVVTERIFADYPDLAEGKLAKTRAAAVSGDTLADIASSIGLGQYIELSPSEERSGGRDKVSILADALEAVIGAIYLDSGLEGSSELVLRLWGDVIAEKASDPGRRDYKTRLQEVLAVRSKRPAYEVTGTGPDHDRLFTAIISVDGVVMGTGRGRSKKAAEQLAAREALVALS